MDAMDTPYRDVEPGLPVRIVMGEDRWAEDIITLDSAIYEVNGASLVLAQTYPPVDDKVRGREVTVTFLGRALDEQPVRLGFPAVIVGCIERYRPATGRAVYEAGRAAGAIRAERKGAAVPFTMRASFRVEPTAASGLGMYVHDEKVRITDISLGGVKFCYEGALGLDGPGPVTLRFDMDGHDYAVDARVLRTWRGKRGLSFAVARFIRVTGPFEQALARKVRAIERKAREAKESSPA